MANLTFKQRILERRMSADTLNEAIRLHVEETDMTFFENQYVNYLKHLDELHDNGHKQFHIDLMTSASPEKTIKTGLRVIIKEALTSSSYIDRNVVAAKIGKKLVKAYKGNNTYKKAVVSLSYGLNVVNALASMNVVSYKMITGADNHNISVLVPNVNLISAQLTDLEEGIRASSFMVTEPRDHTPKKGGGYLLSESTMLNSSGFNTVKAQPTQVCEAMNKLQRVPYSIRESYTTDMINQYMTEDKWYNDKGQFMTGEWNKFIDDLKLAKEVPSIYFPIEADDRVRLYETSAYVKYQGDKYQKSMIEFSNKEVCTDEGLKMLKINVCNEIYNDKISFEDALAFMNSKSIDELRELAKATSNPYAITMTEDLIKAMSTGDIPIGTITHWDATNSGLQFYALLGKDKLTASLCNVFDTGTIADAYQALADALNEATNTNAFNRSNVKNAFMVFLYGAMKAQILFKINDPKNGVREGIREFFPTDWSDDKCWDAFEGAMEEIAPAAINLMNLIYTYNTKDKTKFQWTMPDGAKVETTSTITYNGKRKGKDPIKGWFIDHHGKTHEGSIATTLEEHDPFSRALAPNVIHSIDAYFLREVVRRCDFELNVIHDSFGCHPNNAMKLLQIAREVAAEIVDSDLILDILSQINPAQTAWNERKGKIAFGDLTKQDVLNSNYILR